MATTRTRSPITTQIGTRLNEKHFECTEIRFRLMDALDAYLKCRIDKDAYKRILANLKPRLRRKTRTWWQMREIIGK